MDESTVTFLIVSNVFLLLTTCINLVFKARHLRSSCCDKKIFDLKNSADDNINIKSDADPKV